MATSESFNQWLDLLEDCSSGAKTISDGRIVTDYSTPAKINLLLLLNTAARLASGMVTMGRAGHYTAVSVVARSMLESYASVKRLAECDVHAFYLRHASLEQQRSLFQARLNDPEAAESILLSQRLNSMGKTLGDVVESTKAEMRVLESRLPKEYFNGKGELKRSFHFRFELAELSTEYETFYKSLSNYAHSNASAMMAGTTESGDFRWPPNLEPFPMLAVTLAVDVLIRQSLSMAEMYRLVDPLPMQGLELRQSRLTAQMPSDEVSHV